MSWSNLLSWNVQIAVLVAAAAALPWLFRLRHVHARLVYWQVLLVLCLVLPAVEPWQRSVVVIPAAPQAPAAQSAPTQPAPPPSPDFGLPEAAAALLGAGILLRTAWFGLGLLRLKRYRRDARPLDPLPDAVDRMRREIGVYPEMLVSDEVSGPVTFGFTEPVILFPAQYPGLDPDVQAAVACHELLHVRRRDWLFTAIEEIVRALFWFHPAIWWVLGQIQLSREQSVDREVVKLMGVREQYVDALLALSGARQQLDLAPAPLFLRRRHLTARVAAIVEEVSMPRRFLYVSLAACAGVLLLAGWLVSGSLPLRAAPQMVAETPGVTVTGADQLMHRSPVEYPAEARAKGIEGAVVLDVQIAQDGTVSDATVLSGPMELRRAALASVLEWHFERAAAGRKTITIQFQAAKGADAPTAAIRHTPTLEQPLPLTRIVIDGLAPTVADDLRARLNLREGQTIDTAELQRVTDVVREFDSHLEVLPVFITAGQPATRSIALRIAPLQGITADKIRRIAGGVRGGTIGGFVGGGPVGGFVGGGVSNGVAGSVPGGSEAKAGDGTPPQRIRVGGGVQAAKLKHSVEPVYPALARQARIQGVVRLSVTVSPEGNVNHITAISGHPLLVPAAMEAVRQYTYATTLLNGNPVEVVSEVEVPFSLPPQ